jgi:hypothetical protein
MSEDYPVTDFHEPIEFKWSKKDYEIRKAVREFCENTTSDYGERKMWTKEHHEVVMKVKERIKELGAGQKLCKDWRTKPMITALLNYYAEIRGKEPCHHSFEKYVTYYEYDRKKVLEEFTVPVV